MSSRVFWGFLLVLIGGFLLAGNLGLLTWDIWATLWRAWPVLLVLWGVAVLLRPLGRLGGVITALVALIAAALVLGYAYYFQPSAGGRIGEYALSQSLEEGIERVDLRLDFGAGTLTLDGMAGEGLLASGVLEYVLTEPQVRHQPSGSQAQLDVSFGTGRWSLPPGVRAPRWTVHLSPVPAYTVNVNLGACEAALDLSALTVTDFELKTGAASTTVAFGDQTADLSGRIDIGAASLTLRLPRTVGVRVTMSSGLTGNNLQQVGFEKVDGDWLSPGYAAKTTHFTFRVNAGVSSFNVEWADGSG